MKKGMKKGMEKGKEEGIEEIAKNLKGILPPEEISKHTGLSIEKIKQL